MGRLRLQLAVSADGFIAPVDGSLGWLEPFPADQFGFQAFLASIGAIVLGRRSYDEVSKMGPSPFGALPMLVVTSQPLAPVAHVTSVAPSGLREAVEQLCRGAKDTWLFGGAKTIATCLELKLVDSLELAVVPRLLGDGLPLFARRAPALEELVLVKARKMKKDVLWLEYEIRGRVRR